MIMKLIKLNLEQKTEQKQKPENLAQKIMYFTVLYSAHYLFLLQRLVVNPQIDTINSHVHSTML